MSVLIRGMKMPKFCRACRFAGLGGRSCEMNVCIFTGESQLTLSPERMSKCPLVEVPPHGRLIDADALLERFEKEEKAADEHGRDFSFSFKSGGENCTEWWPVQQMLMDAHTIIPAEEN